MTDQEIEELEGMKTGTLACIATEKGTRGLVARMVLDRKENEKAPSWTKWSVFAAAVAAIASVGSLAINLFEFLSQP